MDAPRKEAEKRGVRRKRVIEVPPAPLECQQAAYKELKRRKRGSKQVRIKEEQAEKEGEEEEEQWYSARPEEGRAGPAAKEYPKPTKNQKRKKPATRTVPIVQPKAAKVQEVQEPPPKKRQTKGKGKEVTTSRKTVGHAGAPQAATSSNEDGPEQNKANQHQPPTASTSDGRTLIAQQHSSPPPSPALEKADFLLNWEKLQLERSQSPTPSTDDLAKVVKWAKLSSLFSQKELNQTKHDFASLKAIEEKLDRIQREVNDGTALVLSLWGSKGVGKSWTANALVNRLLGCNLPQDQIGSLPIPSFSGMGDGSPWPIFIRLMPSISHIRAYRELCTEETYVMRVKSEIATQNDVISEDYACMGADDEVTLSREDTLGEKLSALFGKTETLWDSAGKDLSLVECLKKIRLALDQLREEAPYENLITNCCVIEIPHSLGIEIRDIPGIGHGDWRWARDCDAVRGTDIACVVFFTRLTASDLDKLHQCQLYSEQNFVYGHPPKLVMLPNITLKHKEGVAPDSTLQGDQKPFVQLIKQTVIESLQPNKRMTGAALMWEGMDEDIRTEMLAKTRETAEVIPFYPDPVNLTSGETFDSVKLLQAIIERQKAGKIQNMCMVGMRLARTWLFYAWPSVAKINKAAKKIDNSIINTEIDKFLKSLKNQYIPGLVAKLKPTEETIDNILSKVSAQLVRHYDKPKGSFNKPASTLTNKELREAYIYKMQDQALREINKEIVQWLKGSLKSIKPLRRVMVQDIKGIFKLPEGDEHSVKKADDGLSGAKFPLTQLQTQEEEVFRGIEEWLVAGRKFSTKLQTLATRAWTKVTEQLFKEKRDQHTIREVVEQVLQMTIEHIVQGDPSVRRKECVYSIVRDRMTYSGNNTRNLSYYNDIKQLIEALSITPDQLEEMSKQKKEKLNDLHKELAKHGAAAPKGARKSIYYNPNTVRATLDSLRQTTHKIAQVKSNKAADPPSGALSFDAIQRPKLTISQSGSPRRRLESHASPRIIPVVRTNEGGYDFQLKQSVLREYTNFVKQDEGRLQCPVIATMMETAAMGRLWPCIRRLDQFEPEHGSKYFMFVVVAEEDKDIAQKIFEDCETTYLIILPPPVKDNKGKQKKNSKKPPTTEKHQHELLEVAKQFGEALGELLHFKFFYVLLESVELIREYDSKQCQMVPSTYYRAFQEGIRVYKYLEMQYKSDMNKYLESVLVDVCGLCEAKEIMQQQQKLLTDPKSFNVQELLDILPSVDSFGDQMTKLKKRIDTKKKAQKKTKKLEAEYDDIKQKRAQLMAFLNKVESFRGEYRIGPICISNQSNGDNKLNHVRLGTFFLTKKAVTNMVLFNVKSMQPYRVFNPTRRGPASQKPLSNIVQQMWDHGRPAVIVFNFEYKDKVPSQAVAALDSEATKLAKEIKPDELEANDAHKYFSFHHNSDDDEMETETEA